MRRQFAVVLIYAFSVCSLITSSRIAAHQTESSSANPKRLPVAGLWNKVTVRRDERGIPYIEAKNDHDLYLAQGYVTASDRLWQMDLLRRTARGELAEILGNNALEDDKRHRTFGFGQIAEAEAAHASARPRTVLEAYAQGVNAYIASLDAKGLPPEFQILQYKPRAWTPADSLILVKLFFESLSSTWRLDLMREMLSDLPAGKRAALLPETSPLDVVVVGVDNNRRSSATSEKRPISGVACEMACPGSPAAQRCRGVSAPAAWGCLWSRCQGQDLRLNNQNIFTSNSSELLRVLAEDAAIEARWLTRLGFYSENLAASNNWVVSGKHTASGKPLLANDPHLAPSAPSIWYMVHLTAPGVRVAGVTTAGLPGVVIGHNDHIAWGFTNVGPDVQDLYLEKFDRDNPRRYLTPSGWRNADVRHEEIMVRKNLADSETDTVALDVIVTRHGPIVFERDGKRYALRWTALDPKLNNPEGFYVQDRAHNWKEFTVALRGYTAPTQNMVYADVDGHIGYYAAGVVPIRKSGDGSVPYDGSTDAGEWVSFIPFDKLPHLFDPPSGLIVTANQRTVGNDYPYFLTHSWAQPYRARRIFDLLQKKQKMTADDFREIQGDVYSIAGVTFARAAAKTLGASLKTPDDDQLRQTLSEFDSWDGRLDVDSRSAPIIAQMRTAFRTRILNDALGQERTKSFGWANFDTTLDKIITAQPGEWLPQEFKSYADLLRASHEDARQALTRSMGADESKWTWGNMVQARFPHPLAAAPFVGLQFTIQPFPQQGSGFLVGATVNVGSAVSMRLIADPGDWDKSRQGITLGESGIPSSPHWSDQLADWRAVTPRVFPFSEAAIAKAAKETVLLEPAK
jgi:penicillin G amidase